MTPNLLPRTAGSSARAVIDFAHTFRKILPMVLQALAMVSTWALYAAEDRHVVLITIDGFPARMFWDTNTPIPRLRQLAQVGVAAEGMRICNPTVTWPNHTTLITGVRPATHSVILNGVLVRGEPGLPVKIEEERDEADLVAVPTIFELLHSHGYRTAAIDWPCTGNSEAVDDNFPDIPRHLSHTTPRLRQELIAEGILTNQTDAVFEALGGTEHDEIWTKAACLVLQRRKPHLLVLHLLNTDGVNHRYGPQSSPSYRAFGLADKFVGQVLDCLDAAQIREQTTVIVTADHGFARMGNILQPNVLLRRAGLLEVGEKHKITKARAQAVPEGGMAMVYLTNPETREQDRKTVIALFSGKEGIDEVILPERYAGLGLPSAEQNPRMADLVLAASDGYGFSGVASGKEFVVPVGPYDNRGNHGYLASDSRMNAAFIAAGRRIKPGVKIGLIDNIDVAPTIAALLHEELPKAEGKVMREMLSP